MKVFVVMGNDFPDAVFDSEQTATAYCDAKRKEPKVIGFGPRIYWCLYEFELNGKPS